MIPPHEALQANAVESNLKPVNRPVSRRGKWIGAVIAVLVLAGLGGLTWHLTRPGAMPAEGSGAASGAGSRGGPSGPGAGGPRRSFFQWDT